ncbi:MAG: inorganic phosphate transporter [Thermodesulfobacteriota bacterium]
MFAFFLTSGIFLGWSLGANDASNVFGTAVGSKMIRFRTAAILCSVFVLIGAVISGAGASHTLGKLGAINAVGGAFIVALAAGLSVYLMTKMRFPVSTSQAIVGAIIGWNIFSGSLTDPQSLSKIMMTWLVCPLLAAIIAVILYQICTFVINHFKIHMFTLDKYTRWSLVWAGIFGSYSLGANNIANVMGVFVPVAPFPAMDFGAFTFSPTQILFMLGGVAIGVGVFTYSKRVMLTVGQGIIELTPVAAAVVVWSHSLVLFLFSSVSLQNFLHGHGLPALPLVPVSSSQAVVGAIMGIGLMKKGFFGIQWKTVGGIASGWVTTPIIACLVSLLSLFFLQNVFQQEAYKAESYTLGPAAMERVVATGVQGSAEQALAGQQFERATDLKQLIKEHGGSPNYTDIQAILAAAKE